MRISQKELYDLAELKDTEIFITLETIYITYYIDYLKKEIPFSGSNKNYKAWKFLNNLKWRED